MLLIDTFIIVFFAFGLIATCMYLISSIIDMTKNCIALKHWRTLSYDEKKELHDNGVYPYYMFRLD